MSWTKIVTAQAASTAGATSTSTAGLVTTGADLIVVFASAYGAMLSTDLGDSINGGGGNIWTYVGTRAATGDANCQIACWYKLSPSGGTSHVFTYNHSGVAQAQVLEVLAWSGAIAFDTSASAGGNAVAVLQAGTAIGTSGGLVLSGLAWYANNTMAIGSSFTIENQSAYSAGVSFGAAAAWKTVTGTEDPQWSWTGNNQVAVMNVSFTGTGVGGGSNWGPFILSHDWNRLVRS